MLCAPRSAIKGMVGLGGLLGLGDTTDLSFFGDPSINTVPSMIPDNSNSGVNLNYWGDWSGGGGGAISPGINWNAILSNGFNTGFSIAKQVLAPTQPGYYSPQGTYILPKGASASAINIPGLTSATSSLGGLLPILGIGVVAILLLKGGK